MNQIPKTFSISENIIVYAFRYCLGRKTGAVSECVEMLIKNWDNFTDWTKQQIKREIQIAIKRGDAGHFIDVQEWDKILNL